MDPSSSNRKRKRDDSPAPSEDVPADSPAPSEDAPADSPAPSEDAPDSPAPSEDAPADSPTPSKDAPDSPSLPDFAEEINIGADLPSDDDALHVKMLLLLLPFPTPTRPLGMYTSTVTRFIYCSSNIRR
ncbi:hypothetical protein V6N13_038971 [Hibiscus sabdariffa]|uniref:Uncharacterized protein n=1 Tax=Hibiscus sabdariffa TaxID=183260 RepID=A0ABR2SWW1_9ROSI